MPKKPVPTVSNPFRKLLSRLRRRPVFVALLFVIIVGAIGTYLVTTSSAATPCIKQHVYGQGNAGTCVDIIQRVVRNYGLAQPAKSGYFAYSSRTNLVPGSFVDGIFGPVTAAQVKNFQRWQGIGVDGVVGRQTWTQMCQQPFSYISRSDRKYACGY